MSAVKGLEQNLRWLRRTPLHPQWLISDDQDLRLQHLYRLSGNVLDIGCADKSLEGRLPDGCHYLGLDHYATVHTFYDTRPDLFGDACKLPLRNECMHGVMIFEVLEHVPDPSAALSEIARVLRPGGILLLSVPFLYPIHNAPFDFHRFTYHALWNALTKNGFVVESIEPYLRSLEVGGLMTSLALGDACRQIFRRRRWALPILPFIALLILLTNISARILSRILPGSSFMPSGYRVVATRVL